MTRSPSEPAPAEAPAGPPAPPGVRARTGAAAPAGPDARGARRLPTVSVVIPVRNERGAIEACLTAVQAQRYPRELIDIVVADGGSTDGTPDAVETCAARDPRIRLVRSAAGTIPANLNAGVRAARGDVIARVDVRTLLEPDYLAVAVELLATTGADNVGGPVRSVSRTLAGRALSLAWSSPIGLGGAAARYGDTREHWADTAYLGVFPRRVFETIGLYDEAITQDEDSELNYRLRARGGRVLVSPRLRSRYLNDPTLARIARKNFQFGDCKVAVWQRHPQMLGVRHFAPALFAAGVAAGPPAALLDSRLGALWAAALATYAVLCAGAAAVALCRRRDPAALLLPVVFPLIHLSWGAGFLAGLVRRLPGWFREAPARPVLTRRPAPADGAPAGIRS